MSLARWALAVFGYLLTACDDGVLRAFEPAGAGEGGRPAFVTTPLFIDDFEDGDPRAKLPLGWWYPVNDETSAQGIAIEPIVGGTSVYALRTHGRDFLDWGAALGVNLVGDAAPVKARLEEKLCFAARVEPSAATSTQVHFLDNSDRHYIREQSLTETWARYCLPLSEFVGEDSAFVPDEIIALQFFFAPRTQFAFWLDDVEIAP
jgi:hypothetical protein